MWNAALWKPLAKPYTGLLFFYAKNEEWEKFKVCLSVLSFFGIDETNILETIDALLVTYKGATVYRITI